MHHDFLQPHKFLTTTTTFNTIYESRRDPKRHPKPRAYRQPTQSKPSQTGWFGRLQHPQCTKADTTPTPVTELPAPKITISPVLREKRVDCLDRPRRTPHRAREREPSGPDIYYYIEPFELSGKITLP
jgi:hypothetical protein